MRVAIAAALMGLFVMTASAGAPISGGPGAEDVADLEIGDRIPDRYIVVLRDGVDPAGFARAQGIRPDVTYSHTLNGFAANIPARAAQALTANPNVLFVEPDGIMGVDVLPTGIDRIDVDENLTANIGTGNDLDIDVAVLDTGVDANHSDLDVDGGAGFAGSGFAIFWTCGDGTESFEDGHGHGTHVSGTIGALDDGIDVSSDATDYEIVGVAPGANIYGVKVLTDSGTGAISCIINGVDWVTQQHAEYESSDGNSGIDFAVANMSLGGGNSTALCTAVNNSVNEGIVYAVAAGNSAQDAANSSPANCSGVITVSAIADFDGQPGGLDESSVTFSSCTEDEDDSFACFSNFGSTIEVAAPGVLILSTYANGGYATASGTSMASPHVAGAVALYLLAGNTLTGTSGQTVIDDMTGSGWTVPQDSFCGFTGDPDSDPEPLIYTGSSCLEPADSVTDVAVTAVSAPSSVVQGDVVSIDVTVENVGNQDVGSDITVTLNDDTDLVTIGSETITGGLVAGESATLTYSWDTTEASLGDHTLTGSHGFTDDDSTNDSASTVATVESTITDIAVTAVSAPASAVQGGVVSIDVTVENVGNQDVGSDITVTLNDDTDLVTIGSETITGGLVAGESATLTYSWDTTEASLGDHTLTGSHGFTDDDATNDSDLTVVTVSEASSTMHVGDLDGATDVKGQSGRWEVFVTVTVHDENGSPVSSATVTGTWSGATSGTVSGTTDSSGTVTVSTGNMSGGSAVTLTVDNVTHDSLSYDSSANTDPESDSDGTSITVSKP